MTLESGVYTPSHERKVTVWRGPDANGDGEEIWIDQTDHEGRYVGRNLAKDEQGRPIKTYSPPAGFRNIVTSDRQDSWTKVNEDGSVFRNNTGEAVVIRPGTALVEYSDGSYELLSDEYSQYRFGEVHSRVSGETK